MRKTGMLYGLFGALIGGLLGTGVTLAVTAEEKPAIDTVAAPKVDGTVDPVEDTEEPEPSEEPTSEPVELKPADFEVGIKIRKKKCFGSAGCNITFQIEPKYVGWEDLSEAPGM